MSTPTAQAGLPELPELPEQQYSHFGRGLVPVKSYTADQMCEYALAAVRAAQAAQPERKPLSDAEAWVAINAIFCYRGDYSMAVFRAAEKVHGIGAQE